MDAFSAIGVTSTADRMDKAEMKEKRAQNKASKLTKQSKSLYAQKTFVNKH